MELTRNDLLKLGGVVAAGILLTLLVQANRPLGQDLTGNALARSIQEDRSSPTDGAPDANLTLVVFTDFRCPACRKAHRGMRRAVEKDGKVRIVYKDWPIFGDVSERSARTAIASGFQNIYPPVHDRLMTGPAQTTQDLRLAIERSGGNWARLQHDLMHRRAQIGEQLARNRIQAFQLGLGGTPGYLVGSIRVRGAMTEREFLRVFRKAREATSRQ